MNVSPTKRNQKGYMLLSVMLLVTIMLIMLAVEAPRVTQQIKRQKEQELVNRGTQYAIAIKKFFHKTGNYPTSLDQLEDTNHIRFLRKKFTDPMTGEANWKVIHIGEAEIPLPKNNNPGLQGSGNPSLQGSSTPGPGAQPTPDGKTTLNTNPGQPGQTGGNTLGSLSTQNISNGLGGTGKQFGGGAIIGVASVSKGTGIKEFNDRANYDEWLFVYDPRLEQTSAAAGAVSASATGGIIVASPRAGAETNATGSASPSPSPTPAR
jgi:type II secretory pathway pseudopilin PulG